jgi:hypothetical protein
MARIIVLSENSGIKISLAKSSSKGEVLLSIRRVYSTKKMPDLWQDGHSMTIPLTKVEKLVKAINKVCDEGNIEEEN